MKNRVDNFYKNAQQLKEHIEHNRQQLRDMEREYQERLFMYRIASVNRVLEYIDTQVRHGHPFSLDKLSTLMVHCQNKLNGNIDGIELSLDEEDDL